MKKTCKKRFTAFISTARRYSHASPDILQESVYHGSSVCEVIVFVTSKEVCSLWSTVFSIDKLDFGRLGGI